MYLESVTIDSWLLGALILFISRPFCSVPERVRQSCTFVELASLPKQIYLPAYPRTSICWIFVLRMVPRYRYATTNSKTSRPFVLAGPTPGSRSFALLELRRLMTR